MSGTLEKIQRLAIEGKIRISSHGYDRLSEEGILFQEVLEGLSKAMVVEKYPKYAKGPCVLVLPFDSALRPLHVFGESQKTRLNRACSSQGTDLIRLVGAKIFFGGMYEPKTPCEVDL